MADKYYDHEAQFQQTDDPVSSTGLIKRIFITRSGSGIKARKAHGPEVYLLLERINNSAT